MAHSFTSHLAWENAHPSETFDVTKYSRLHTIAGDDGKHTIEATSAPEFRGVSHRWNPEEMLTAALSSCQMLTYLALAAKVGITVLSYTDSATGILDGEKNREWMTEVTLRPRITITDASQQETALSLVEKAHKYCFIANSVKTKVKNEAEIIVK